MHFAETGAKLISAAGPLAGKALQYLHIDSWEIGQPNWTPKMREEFQKRRGYDLLFWLPAVLGMPVDSQEATEKFMRDYRRTVADLVAENYYGRLNTLSIKGGLKGAHSEAGGPIGCHFFWGDGLRNMGVNAIPMGEFWKRNSEPDGDIFYGPYNHTIRQAASAAHIYGKPICQAEAFTSFGLDWCEAPWDMKDLGDAAFCDGLTRMVFHHWAHQPFLDAKPGFQWGHVGTHYDSNLTWWPMAEGWLAYLARCQHLLRQGLFVGDFAYLQTEDIPSFAARKMDQQPMRPAGFDYDAMSADALIARASAKDGRLVMPDGMSYRYLVLPHGPNAFLTSETLKKVNELAETGVTVVGPAIFGGAVTKLRQDTLDAIVKADGVLPDVEFRNRGAGMSLDWIHRRDGGADVYFISNQTTIRKDGVTTEITFRVAGKRPELWDPVTGRTRELAEYKTTEDGRTVVPLTFAPRQRWFVVFRKNCMSTTKKVSDDVLMPAVSVSRKRTLYNTYDISKYLKPGTNCVGVWLGLGLCYHRNKEAPTPLARVELDMTVGGQSVVVGTDSSWLWMESSHTEFGWGWGGNGVEHIDARLDIPNWSEVGCTNGQWKSVEEFAGQGGEVTAQACPPNRITKKFPVVKCTAMTPNTYEIDFGTNLNGWFTLRLPKLEAGHKVTIRFADKRLKSAKEEVTAAKTYELPPGAWKLETANGPVAYTIYSQTLEFTSAGKTGEQIWPKFNY